MLKLVSADYNNPQHAAAILELLSLYARDPMGGGQDLSDYVRQHLIEQLAARQDAKMAKDWAKADAIREQLNSLGIIVKDTKEGATWERN